MIVYLLTLTLSYSYNVSTLGYTKKDIYNGDSLFLSIGSQNKAYLIFSSDISGYLDITVYKNGYSKKYNPSYYNSKAISIEANEANIDFNGYYNMRVTIWIIPKTICQSYSIYVMGPYYYTLTASVIGYSDVCVFPANSYASSSVYYGHTSSFYGNAYIYNENSFSYSSSYTPSCLNGGKCYYSESNQFFVSYNLSASSIIFENQLTFLDSYYNTCSDGYFINIDIYSMTYTSPFSSSSYSCTSESGSGSIIAILVVSFLIIILVPILCCCCAGAAVVSQTNNQPTPLLHEENDYIPNIQPNTSYPPYPQYQQPTQYQQPVYYNNQYIPPYNPQNNPNIPPIYQSPQTNPYSPN